MQYTHHRPFLYTDVWVHAFMDKQSVSISSSLGTRYNCPWIDLDYCELGVLSTKPDIYADNRTRLRVRALIHNNDNDAAYRQTSSIRLTKSEKLNVSRHFLQLSLLNIHWSHVLSREWRCIWSSTDRRCSNYIWAIDNFIAYWGATYIRSLTVIGLTYTIHYIDGLVQGCSKSSALAILH